MSLTIYQGRSYEVYSSALMGDVLVCAKRREILVPAKYAGDVIAVIYHNAAYASYVLRSFETGPLSAYGAGTWKWFIEYGGALCPKSAC